MLLTDARKAWRLSTATTYKRASTMHTSAASGHHVRSSVPGSEKVRVLIVDDDDDDRALFARFLRRFDFDVIAATSGKQALEAIGERNPDVVLLDLVMPGMDGVETCRQLRSSEMHCQLPVLILTGQEDPRLRARALSAGANDLALKPTIGFGVDEFSALAQRIHELLANSRGHHIGR